MRSLPLQMTFTDASVLHPVLNPHLRKDIKPQYFAEQNHMVILGLEKSPHHRRVKEINLFN